jgi:hypothetical protein
VVEFCEVWNLGGIVKWGSVSLCLCICNNLVVVPEGYRR